MTAREAVAVAVAIAVAVAVAIAVAIAIAIAIAVAVVVVVAVAVAVAVLFSLPWLLLVLLPLTCDLKRAEHRSQRGAKSRQLFERSVAQRVLATPRLWRGAQGTAAQRRRVSGANGFGYFCQDKSNPLLQERKLLLVILSWLCCCFRAEAEASSASDRGDRNGASQQRQQKQSQSKCKASARKRAGYFCSGKSNQNHLLLTRSAAARRSPALLAKEGRRQNSLRSNSWRLFAPSLTRVLGSL